MTDRAASPGPIHHTGFVVRAMAPAEAAFGALGYRRMIDTVEDERQDAEILFLRRDGAAAGEPLVELIVPRSDKSPVAAFARESRLRIHHLCFAVDDIEAALAPMKASGISQVTPIVDAPAIGGKRIVFLFSREMGLFELVERPPF